MHIVKWLFFAGYEKKVYDNLKEELAKLNRTRLIVFSIFFASACLVMTVSSFMVESIESMRYTYLSFFALSLLILLLTTFLGKSRPGLITHFVYLFVAIVLAFGILIGTVLSPKEISATYIALLLLAPQLFTGKSYRMHIVTLVMNIAFIFMVIKVKDAATWNTDIINALIFYAVSVLISIYSTNTMISRFIMEQRVRDLAEVDQLTGLLNRNSYETALKKVEKHKKGSIYCVYLDVNGLHELNNKEGHAAGDRMLIYIAKAMQSIFGDDKTFRIGGDEFVAVGYNLEAREIEERISNLKNKIISAGYHAAIGYCREIMPEIHVQHIVKDAESKMYVDKKAYYEKEGKNPQRIH